MTEIEIKEPALFIKAISLNTSPPTDDPHALPAGVVVTGATCHVIDYRASVPTVAAFPLTEEEHAQLLALAQRIAQRLSADSHKQIAAPESAAKC